MNEPTISWPQETYFKYEDNESNRLKILPCKPE